MYNLYSAEKKIKEMQLLKHKEIKSSRDKSKRKGKIIQKN